MSNDSSLPSSPADTASPKPSGHWYSDMTKYHWLVVILCTCGWTFDCFDQQLFSLSRAPAIAELLGVPESDPNVAVWGGWATSLMLIGWATGGIFFGIWADKFGRVRIMCITLAFYALFTGFCGIAQSLNQFLLFRFLVGLGVGGQFAVCATLIAETLSNRARPFALGAMQAFSACGNVAAAGITFILGELILAGILPWSTWRWAFFVGLLPIILVYLDWKYLREPDVWKKTKKTEAEGGQKTGSILELFGDRVICYRVVMGMLFASIGVVGFWGIMTFSIDLNRAVFVPQSEKWAVENLNLTLSAEENNYLKERAEITMKKEGKNNEKITAIYEALSDESKTRISNIDKMAHTMVGRIGALTSFLMNLGGFFGVFSFTFITNVIGRRKTFTLFLLASMFSVLGVFLLIEDLLTLCIFVPLMGFSIVSLMGGYTIYFPELFPTRLRSTAVSFCYNVGRYLAAVGPGLFGFLTVIFESSPQPIRMAGACMSPVFLLGIILIWMLPETHGKPLPE